MNNDKALWAGQKLRFKPVQNDISELLHFVRTEILPLNSIQAVSILDRLVGSIFPKRQRTLIVFYDIENNYKVDSLTISEKLTDFYKNKSDTIELLSFDMAHEFTLSLVQTLTNGGIEIIDK